MKKIRIPLSSTALVGGVKINQLVMREPCVKDQLEIHTLANSDAERELMMFARLTDLTGVDLKKVGLRDLGRLQRAYTQLVSEPDGRGESVIEPVEDGTTSLRIPLSTPISINGVEESELVMREPCIGDQLDLDKLAKNDAERELIMFARLVESAPEDLQALTLRDLGRLQKGYLRHLADAEDGNDGLVEISA